MLIEGSPLGLVIYRKRLSKHLSFRTQSGKNSMGGPPQQQQQSQQHNGLCISSVGGGAAGANFGGKSSGVGKKSSKSYLRKNGPAITSLNLHLYGSSGKSRNSVHSKHINSL